MYRQRLVTSNATKELSIVMVTYTSMMELQARDMNNQLDIKELEKVMQKVNALWTSV